MLDLSQAFASALRQITNLDPQLIEIIALSLKVTLTAVAYCHGHRLCDWRHFGGVSLSWTWGARCRS